ncbi:glycosyl hydrolase family 8 [Agarilytica rhodophyticola]|uniref:glycosyl hydrolase family 8 n=1 Tax=Agarilytica rhodophyticola TaxID=1737490 RepID=UPI000B3491DF|nr:glycosyl hydrolase family 8 [Agarilytica rhodophyticola]
MNMKKLKNFGFLCILWSQLFVLHDGVAAPAFETGVHRNLFVEMGIAASEQEVDNKVLGAYQQLFHGDASSEKVYFEVDNNMAYILAVDSDDIRSEGMSYGMTVAVMMNDQVVFDKLWNFSKTKMQHQTGDRKGYFSWQLQASAPFTAIDKNAAPDGEEYFVMALMFASNRWGDGEGIYNYSREANFILDEMVNKATNATQVPIINPNYNQVIFTPDKRSEAFTDPSYHLPAFYELWSRWAIKDNSYWRLVAETSRDFFENAAHPVTGLYTDYANFDGSPKVTSFNPNSHLSAFDAMRTIQNVAVDYAWFEDDPRSVELANRILTFYNDQGNYVTVYTHDGVPQVEYRSEGHVAMNAVAALASDLPIAKRFVEDLWQLPIPTGKYRYYNGLLYMLGLLHTSGKFKIIKPSSNSGIPSAGDVIVTTNKNESVDINLLGSDPGGQIASYSILSSPTHGSAVLNENIATYTPVSDFVGNDSFSYIVIDNDGNQSQAAKVTISVNELMAVSCNIGNADIWNSGFVLNNIVVTNTGTETLNGWKISIPVQVPVQISGFWNANVVVEDHIIFASSDNVLAPGQSNNFGFQGSHNGGFVVPECLGSGVDTSPTPGDNIPGTGSTVCEYNIQNEWDSGFVASIRITNNSTTVLTDWQLNWEYNDGSTIVNYWNAVLSGNNPYLVASNVSISPGQSIEFGIQGEKSSANPAQIPSLMGSACQ